MAHPLAVQLVAVLWLWSLGSLGSAVVGLYAHPREAWRAFWLMTGLWGLVDGGVAWYALVWPAASPSELAPVLRFNAGLDVVYLLVGAALAVRPAPRPRGFGLAVLVQGAFLLAFDAVFAWRCAAPV